MRGTLVLFAALLSTAYLSVVEGLRVDGKPTYSVTPPPVISPVYSINSTMGTTCILIRADGILGIKYRNKLNEEQEVDIFLPDYPELSGNCSDSDSQSLTMAFKGFTLSMYFKKTPGRKRWYISSMEVAYSSSNSIFEHIDRPNLDIRLTTRSKVLFPTPVGKSYTCDQEQEVLMYSPDKNDESGHIAKLYLRDLRMQSFMYKVSGKWGPPFKCSATGTYRNETAPLAVGTALAVAVLAPISGYGV